VVHALFRAGGELETPSVEVALDHGIEAGLVDGHLAGFEHLDLAFIDIDTDDMVAGIGQASAGNQAHVAGAEYRYSHT